MPTLRRRREVSHPVEKPEVNETKSRVTEPITSLLEQLDTAPESTVETLAVVNNTTETTSHGMELIASHLKQLDTAPNGTVDEMTSNLPEPVVRPLQSVDETTFYAFEPITSHLEHTKALISPLRGGTDVKKFIIINIIIIIIHDIIIIHNIIIVIIIVIINMHINNHGATQRTSRDRGRSAADSAKGESGNDNTREGEAIDTGRGATTTSKKEELSPKEKAALAAHIINVALKSLTETSGSAGVVV
ncbi:separin [Colletotrichum lupini]|uniref:Separin n=1 Tax=Colletotrichum lupini TaxID=145971 RepID=A0A9Q8SGA2_9PEZI|nr:separin [Colletotrichum lupini]UQC76846.1 separin [Colletotrichum lupini]